MGINLKIQELKETIANVVNEAGLPAGLLLMIFNEFARQTESLYLKAIEIEKQELQKEGAKDGKEIHKD